MPDFVHLHTHSDFSLLDGATSISQLITKTEELGIKHLALTDHGNMFGSIQFYKECIAHNINPIVGSEFYVAPVSRHKKGSNEGKTKFYHLVLLATNEAGYRNLLKLSSYAYTEGFYYKPRIDEELLLKHSTDLIASTACIAGEIPRLILEQREEEALNRALFFSEVFGKDRFYLELQNHGIPEQKIVNKELIRISKKTGIPLIATNDIHYLNRDDAKAQDVLICIGTNKKINDVDRLKFSSAEFYYKSPDEMALLFPECPEALKNTLKIAEMCNLSITLPGPTLPEYEIPRGYTIQQFFYEISYNGLKKRYETITEEIKNRFEYEISVITTMNFIGYFLIVWDFIKFAREHNIPVGPGRGSGAGSIIAYSLRITDIDPLKYNLLFERFLNPDRVSMPDFDIDFCYEKRGDVIDYVTQKYGTEKVGQIITFGTLKAKAVIRDVARVLDINYSDADSIAKMVPAGPKITLEKALSLEPRLTQIAESGETYKELIEISKKLEGLRRHASTHAAGIVIGKTELTDYIPLYKEPKTGSISTQYTMEYLEECGLVKMDFLGLKTLTVIQNTLNLLKRRGIDLKTSEIPENDKATFKLLGQGKSTCIFQFESSGMQNILKKAKPEKIEDLIALNALYRPGPMDNIDQFIESKFNPHAIKYPLPELKPVLKETYGVIVYQEQVMEIAKIVGGFSLGQADILRRAMGKKKIKVMDQMWEKFLAGAIEQGYTKEIADKIFKLLIPFAGYGFNKSHAAAYSVLAYHTAYLKANYPAEFMAANLTNEISNPDKLAEYIHEARGMGLEIQPPDINLSEKEFSVVENKIVYGLKGVRNVGTAAVEAIIACREEEGPFKDFFDFLERVDLKTVNKKVIETLICSGLFHSYGETRSTLFSNLERFLDYAHHNKEMKLYGQASLFDGVQDEGIFNMEFERIPEYPQKQLLDWEKEYLGFFFSGHPLDKFRQVIKIHTNLNLSEPEKAIESQTYTIVGILKNIKEIITKAGTKMAFGLIEDFNGSIELVVFSKTFEKYRSVLQNDMVIAVTGRIDLKRGDPKFIVNDFLEIKDIMKEEVVVKKAPNAIHIQLSGNVYHREHLHQLKEFCLEKKGNCTLYLHPDNGGKDKADYIRAGTEIKVSADEEFIDKLLEFPHVAKVWKE
ncbi:MAG: DNA polymerase III subunit alpha [Spirochaetales bacterium]|nr:DNA polymerase III subunit alpha [Spirochaetales bacterium]